MILYLHAGTHKTGTTAIQSFLYPHRDLLEERGLYVPLAGLLGTPPEMGHHNIAFELGGRQMDPAAGGLDALVAELAERAPERAVVSSENFYPLSSDPDALRLLRDRTEAIGVRIRPILYFRPQAMLLEALYVEFVKHGMTEPFDAFLDEALENGAVTYNEATYDVDYDRVVASFADVFGRDAMIVRPYENAPRAEDFIAQFLGLLVPEAGDLDLTELGAWERRNLSVGFRAVASNLYANRSVEGDPAFEDVLDELMRDKREAPEALLRPHGRYWDGKFEPLGVDDLARLYARFGDGNRILRATYGIEVPVCPPSRLFDEVRARR
ncbi:MAG TPA: hypothetical protein VIG46_12470 [Candidatus Baltobacteraceae bacterium]|jgi:hypothetical protein